MEKYLEKYLDVKLELKKILKPDRYSHTLYTAKEAVKLASIYNVNEEKAYLSALLHDCAKNLSNEELYKIVEEENMVLDDIMKKSPALVHGLAGSILAQKKYGIKDEEIINAIRYHTTGKENMNMLEKIIFLSDATEESRRYEGVEEIRKISYIDINKAIVLSLDRVINFVILRGNLLHLDTVKARNYLINEGN